MGFNGAGVFGRLYNWVTDRQNGVKILANRVDDEMDGMATALSTMICRDGQSTVIADIRFGGHRVMEVADPITDTDAANRRSVIMKSGDVMSGDLQISKSVPALGLFSTVSGNYLLRVPDNNRLQISNGTGTFEIASFGSDGSMALTGRLASKASDGSSGGPSMTSSDGRQSAWTVVSGYFAMNIDGTGYGVSYFASDERYKDNIQNSNYDALDRVKRISFKSFDMKPDMAMTGHWTCGVTSQSLQVVEPEWVDQIPGSTGVLLPNTNKLLMASLRAIQQLEARVAMLETAHS